MGVEVLSGEMPGVPLQYRQSQGFVWIVRTIPDGHAGVARFPSRKFSPRFVSVPFQNP